MKKATVRRQTGKIRPTLLLIVAALPALGSLGCGGAARENRATPSNASPPTAASPLSAVAHTTPTRTGHLRDDADPDGPAAASLEHNNSNGADSDSDSYGNTYYDEDDENVLDYGHAASAADAHTLTAAITRYYATAASGNGSALCDLITPDLAQSVTEGYGHSSQLPALHGNTCPVVMSKLLVELHSQISSDNAGLKVGVVRVKDATARILLSFDTGMPNSYMILQHEGGAWKITELLAGSLP